MRWSRRFSLPLDPFMSQESFKDGERRIDISQTRDLEKISPSGQPQHVEEEDFPDGGPKAWLMIAGVES